jgi:seryl-tRNA synthetase
MTDIVDEIVALKIENKGIEIEIKNLKEKQNKIIEKLNKIIKKTNNMCFIYTSSDDSDNDSDNSIVDYLKKIKVNDYNTDSE